ncbi:hypothetical protein [Streptomyces sp. NPDC002467]|uniref:hypothetical protein n=1 Tax=Streptomyces sp. NPDC002467 TaxID=3364647 RepID=UPI0036C52D0D
MTAAPFDRAAARRRLGPDAVAAIEAVVAAAPPLTAEARMQLQAVFASAPKASSAPPMAA